jgi:hypothetical protein
MPRPVRLDAPDTLHRVMVRGLDRRVIFTDDTDRADFVIRMRNAGRSLVIQLFHPALKDQ